MKGLNRNNSMCYTTAHREHAKINPNYELILSLDQPQDFRPYFKKGFYTVEFEITDLDYPHKKQGFFLPRLIAHTFNVHITEDSIVLYQSWFMEFKYQRFYYFDDMNHFHLFLEEFRDRLENYQQDPKALFKLFGYESFWKLTTLLSHVRRNKTNKLKYRIDIFG